MNLVGVGGLAVHSNSGRPLWAYLEKDRAVRSYSRGLEYSWPERANQIHTRDILFIAEISRVVERILEEKEQVTVLSGQAGMVIYYLAKEFPGRVEFVDRFGLSTRHFVALKEEIGLQPTPFGLGISYQRLFEEARSREGRQWHPDVIFEIYSRVAPVVDRNGYKIVYEQTGGDAPYLEREGSALYPLLGAHGPARFRQSYSAYQFAAVKDEWSHLFEPSVRRFDWTRARLASLQEPRE